MFQKQSYWFDIFATISTIGGLDFICFGLVFNQLWRKFSRAIQFTVQHNPHFENSYDFHEINNHFLFSNNWCWELLTNDPNVEQITVGWNITTLKHRIIWKVKTFSGHRSSICNNLAVHFIVPVINHPRLCKLSFTAVVEWHQCISKS